MKKLLKSVIVVAVFAALFFAGCQNPFIAPVLNEPEPAAKESGGEITTGVTFTIPRYAPWIGPRFAPKAFGFVDGVYFTVYDSSMDEVISEYVVPPSDVEGEGSFKFTVILGAGIGYTAKVEIFNQVVSETEPMVSGESDPFDITQGVVTEVPVNCIPLNPIELTNSDTDYTQPIAATPLDADGYPVATGGEVWYSIITPASGYLDIAVTIPADVSFYYGVFDSAGAAVVPVGSDIGGPGPDVIHGQGTPGATYYMGLVPGAYEASGDIDVTMSWTEVIPTYLSDIDVPDPALRELMLEYFPGKEFSVGDPQPDPANRITGEDLATLGDFRTDGSSGLGVYTTITDLTGFEYCTGVGYLQLGGNDLSATDFSVLQNLTNLYALDLWDCNLQNLSLIDYLVNPDFHHLKVFGNPALTLTEITSVTAAMFPGMRRLAFGGFDATGDGIADDVSSADWTTLVGFLATHTVLEELTLSGSLNFTDSMFVELVTDVIAPKASDWLWLDFGGNPNLTDISPLSGLSNLYSLQLYSTAVSDLTPVWNLHNNDGAFTNPGYNNHINITGCNMDLWPGTTNRTIVDNLIGAGVSINYEAGNYLENLAPVPLSAFPDPELRVLMEELTGKSFTGLEGGITYADLNGIDEINSSSYTNHTITDLTGFELCDNAWGISIGNRGNDLSGCDLSVGGAAHLALAGMDNLDFIQFANCNLSTLDFLQGLEGIGYINVAFNDALTKDDLLIFNSTNFPSMWALFISGYDTNSDGNWDPVPSGDWAELLAMLDGHDGLTELALWQLGMDDAELSSVCTQVLGDLTSDIRMLWIGDNDVSNNGLSYLPDMPQLEYLHLSWSPNVTDISLLPSLSALARIDLTGTPIEDLTPLWQLYTNGAFTGEPLWGWHIDISSCGLDLTPGSANRAIVEDLLAAGIQVAYEAGNQIYTEVISWENVFANPNGAYIHGMTYDGTDLWMVGRDTNTIYRVSSTDGSVLSSIPAPTTDYDGTGLTYDGTSLWYTHDQSPRMIYEVNPSTGTVIDSFNAPGGGDSTGLAWDGTYLWNTGFGEDIYQLDTAGTVQTSFAAPTSTPEGMTFANGYLWAIGYSNTLYKLNPADGTIAASYSTPSANLYGLTSDGTYLWLSTSGGSIKKHTLSGL